MSVTASLTQDHHAQFIDLLATSLKQNAFIKLVLAKYVGTETDLQRLIIKQLTVKDQPCLCLLYTSPSPRDRTRSRMPSSA